METEGDEYANDHDVEADKDELDGDQDDEGDTWAFFDPANLSKMLENIFAFEFLPLVLDLELE